MVRNEGAGSCLIRPRIRLDNRESPGQRGRWDKSKKFVPTFAERTAAQRFLLLVGTRSTNAARRFIPRFTPACAGSRPEFDHDHVGSRGSSPLARGAVQVRRVCVGRCTVHPRLRGEHEWTAAPTDGASGSSPLARGALRVIGDVLRRDRFIPACAGSRWQQPRWRYRRAVHPRLRGEQWAVPGPARRAAGFIPACAGSSEDTEKPLDGVDGSSPLARGADSLTRDDTARMPGLKPVTS